MTDRQTLIAALESRFRALSSLLYDTSVPPAEVDAQIAPLIDEQIRFTDPWQQASGRARYRLGAAGFHAMLRFDLEITQVSVQLKEDGSGGRALVDSIMNLRPLGKLFTYPLRTILAYEFRLDAGAPDGLGLKIFDHEEMWSIADMVAAVPLLGRLYQKTFRPGFSVGFLAASWLSARARGMLPEMKD